MADKLSLVGFISELGISRSLAGRCGHVSREEPSAGPRHSTWSRMVMCRSPRTCCDA